MGQKIYQTSNELEERYLFWCPGCECAHFWLVPQWTWDGNWDSPTVSPSILVRGGGVAKSNDGTCHLFLRNGQIQYLGDCTHELAGKTVDLEEF